MRVPEQLQRAARYLWREWIKPAVSVAIIIFPLKSALADWNWVPTGSMKPTILEGDLVFVNKLAYDQLVYTPNDLIPEYITFDITTERGGSADSGKVVVVEADNEDVDLFVDFAGAPVVDDTKPAVLVGAKRAIDIDELGSTPFTVDALEIAKGGIDRALHGYLQEHTVRPRSLALIGTAVAGG